MSSAIGINPGQLASQYTQIERSAKDQQLSTKSSLFSNQIKAFDSLKSNLSSFFDDLQASLKDTSSLFSNTATVSNPSALGVSATGTAASGEYDVFVEQLAQAHQVALSFDPAKALTTDGELSIDLAGSAFSIDFASLGADASLTDVANAINSHVDNSGVKASVVRSGTEAFLTLTSAEPGAANQVGVSFTPAADANGSDITNAITNKQDLTLAQDAIVKLGANSALTITSSSNKLDTVIDGVTIDLTQAQSPGDQPIHISINQDQESSKENIQSFVDKFNSLTNGITSNQYLKRDNMAAGLARSLRNDFQGTFEGKTLFSVGIEFDRSGNLKIDNKKLEEAMATNPEQLTSMLTGENGLLSKLETRVEPFTKSYGLMTDKKQSLQASLNIVTRQQKDHEVSMEQVYQRYLSQFTQMQQTIAQLESTMGQFGG